METGKKIYENIDEYIRNSPEEIRTILETLRETIKKAAPEAGESINYGIPTFKLNGNLVHFAGFKTHIGFYPGPDGIEKFKNELSKYELSKGTVRFPVDKPLPLNLIKKIVKFRVAQNTGMKKTAK